MVEHPEISVSDDPPLAFARMIGLQRLAAPSRLRLQAAIEHAGTRAGEGAA